MTPTRLVLVLAALALAGCSRSAAPAASRATPPPLPPDVQGLAAVAAPAPAEGGATGQAGVSLTGEFVSPVRSELVMRLPGRVAKVLADEGQAVRHGQPLLELETEYLQIELRRAEAELARATAASAEARRDLERKRGLLAKGSVSQAVHDRSLATAEQAAAGVAAAQAALDLARQRLADAVLLSPIDGVVAERRTDVGERLGDGSVAFVVEQTAPLKLRFRVPERYLTAVRAGQPVEARVDPYPGQAFGGRVALVGGTLDPATRTFLVEAEFANRDGRLRPGLFARVVISSGLLAPAGQPAPAASGR